MVGIAQLVRAPDCGSGCRGFESLYPPQTSRESRNSGSGSFFYPETQKAYNGVSPSGKARDFDSRSRWFESGHPSHFLTAYDPIAQSVEHLPFKQGVRGSSPRWVTNKKAPPNGGAFLLVSWLGDENPGSTAARRRLCRSATAALRRLLARRRPRWVTKKDDMFRHVVFFGFRSLWSLHPKGI